MQIVVVATSCIACNSRFCCTECVSAVLREWFLCIRPRTPKAKTPGYGLRCLYRSYAPLNTVSTGSVVVLINRKCNSLNDALIQLSRMRSNNVLYQSIIKKLSKEQHIKKIMSVRVQFRWLIHGFKVKKIAKGVTWSQRNLVCKIWIRDDRCGCQVSEYTLVTTWVNP